MEWQEHGEIHPGYGWHGEHPAFAESLEAVDSAREETVDPAREALPNLNHHIIRNRMTHAGEYIALVTLGLGEAFFLIEFHFT